MSGEREAPAARGGRDPSIEARFADRRCLRLTECWPPPSRISVRHGPVGAARPGQRHGTSCAVSVSGDVPVNMITRIESPRLNSGRS